MPPHAALDASAKMQPLASYLAYPETEMRARAADFYAQIRRRRSVRDFSPRPVSHDIIADALRAAGTAPSGANQQPWHFAVIADTAVKHRIRVEAEREEAQFYGGRAPEEWLEALAPLGTDASKPFLEIAPILIAVFAQRYGTAADGTRTKHYYVPESVGIATGFLIACLHYSGLATLTHTPSPMNFLNEICQRPDNEKPYILLVVGYPADGCTVPVAGGIKKPLDAIATWI